MYAKEIFWITVWLIALAVFIASIAIFYLAPYLWFMLALSLAAVVILTVPCVYWGLAPLNICFTFVYEGTAKIVVSGKAAVGILIQYRGHTLDPNTGDVSSIFDSNGNAIPGKKEESHLFGGLRFYGIWPFLDIHTHKFSWTAMSQGGEAKEHPKETHDYIGLFDDVYWFEVVKAEDEELVPLNAEVLARVRIINPYKALFVAQDWLEMLINLVKPLVRKEISDSTYEKLTAARESLGKKIYTGAFDLWQELERSYGIKVLGIEVKEIDPPEELRALTLKKVTALREAEVVAIEAEAEKKRISTVYQALAEAGDLGKLIRSLEAIEKAPQDGSKLVIVPPGIFEPLSQVFQAKS